MATLTPVDNDPFATAQPKLTPVDHDPFAASASVPWFSAGPGNDKIGEFFAKAGDAATLGLGAKAQDALGIGQKDGQTVAQQVGAAGQDIGPVASAGADLLGYAAGPGMVGVGDRLAGLMGGRLLARMGGSAAEGAGASALGTAGHGDMSVGDLLKAAALGGTVGAATGALPGGAGPRPTTPSTADLQATASDLYAPLRNKSYNAGDVGTAIGNITSGMSAGDAASMGSRLADVRDVIAREVGNRGTVTADDIAKFQRELGSAAGGSDTKQQIAQQYVAALNKGVGSKTTADIAAANRASNIAKTGGEIEGWAANPSGAPAAVKSALTNNPDFYKTQPGLFDALNAIAKKAPGEESVASAAGKAAASAVGKHLLGAAIGGGVGYMTGQGMPGDLAGLAIGAAAPMAVGRMANRVASIPTRNALLAAQHLNATGMPVNPGVYTPRWLQIPGMLARQGGYAAGASGAF